MNTYQITGQKWEMQSNGKLKTVFNGVLGTIQAMNAQAAIDAFKFDGEYHSKGANKIETPTQPEPIEPIEEVAVSEVAPIDQDIIEQNNNNAALTSESRAKFCTAIVNDGLQKKFGFVSGGKSRSQVEPTSVLESDTDVVITLTKSNGVGVLPAPIVKNRFQTIYITLVNNSEWNRFVFRNSPTVGEGAFFSCLGTKTALVLKKIHTYLSEGRNVELEGFDMENLSPSTK